jgi:hypothetical protein
MEVVEIGSCQAILEGVSTKVDGSISIRLNINPEDQSLAGKLIKCFAENDKLLQVAFVKVAQ